MLLIIKFLSSTIKVLNDILSFYLENLPTILFKSVKTGAKNAHYILKRQSPAPLIDVGTKLASCFGEL